MRERAFGRLPPVSTLTLGGGGLGMLWGGTTFDECVATVHAAVAAGITLLDLAPRYGDGKAEEVVGEAFSGQLPHGVRVTSKCNLGNLKPTEIEPTLRKSIEDSLRLTRPDLLGVKNRREFAECVEAAEAGPLSAALMAEIDATVDR